MIPISTRGPTYHSTGPAQKARRPVNSFVRRMVKHATARAFGLYFLLPSLLLALGSYFFVARSQQRQHFKACAPTCEASGQRYSPQVVLYPFYVPPCECQLQSGLAVRSSGLPSATAELKR